MLTYFHTTTLSLAVEWVKWTLYLPASLKSNTNHFETQKYASEPIIDFSHGSAHGSSKHSVEIPSWKRIPRSRFETHCGPVWRLCRCLRLDTKSYDCLSIQREKLHHWEDSSFLSGSGEFKAGSYWRRVSCFGESTCVKGIILGYWLGSWKPHQSLPVSRVGLFN